MLRNGILDSWMICLLIFSSDILAAQSIRETRFFKEEKMLMNDQSAAEFLHLYLRETYHFESTFKLVAQNQSQVGKHFTYYQTYRGFPIHNSFIKLNVANNGSVLSLIFQGYNTAAWLLDSQSAKVALWEKEYQGTTFLNKEVCIDVLNNQPEMVLKLTYFDPRPLVCETWLINESGPYSKENNVTYFKDTTIKVRVFSPDPLTTAKSYYRAPFLDYNDSNYTEIDAQQKIFEVKATFDESNNTFLLRSGKKEMNDINGTPVNNVPALTQSNFYFTRNQKEFESVNAFYHISQMENYIKSLGLNNLDASPLSIDGQGKEDDNSAFVEALNPKVILFGLGGVDDAEDADVVVHEYMHYVSAMAAPNSNNGFERTAIDEGLADYFATAYSKNIDTFRWQDMFTWDGHNEYWKGRRMVNSRTYPDSLIANDIHTSGLILAGMMIDLHDAIGRKDCDLLMLNAMYNFFPLMGYDELTTILLQTEKALFNEKYKCLLLKNMRERGLVSPEVNIACYEPLIPIEAGFSGKTVCKNDQNYIGINPESLIHKDYTYFWHPTTYLTNFNTSNPIFISDTNFNYQLTVCDKQGKCNSKNIAIETQICHKEISFFNSAAFSAATGPLIIRLPDEDNSLTGYVVHIFNDQGRLLRMMDLLPQYVNYFTREDLPDIQGIYFLKVIKMINGKETTSRVYRVIKI